MAELDSEDSLDGALVIDEPQEEPKYDFQQIKIIDDSDSDMDIIEIKDSDEEEIFSSPDVEIIEIKDSDEEEIFSSPDLLCCIQNFKESSGNCVNVPNVQLATKRKISEDRTSEVTIKNKRDRSPKLSNVFKNPVPPLIPMNKQISPPKPEPQVEKKIPNLQRETKMYNPTIIENDLPSLSQMLLNEIEPEYQCETCGEIFRHNIGLICHSNDAHNMSSVTDTPKKRKTSSNTKVCERKKSIEKTVVQENKQIENNEPLVETINLTLLPDLKKDTLINRMKSYVYSHNKSDVICVLCNAEFKSTKRALAHVEDKHISQKIECGYCNMKFVYELKLRSHMSKKHNVIGVYKCEKCAKMINREEYESHSAKCTGQISTMTIKIEEDT